MGDGSWPLTTVCIENTLTRVRATPCGESAYCPDEESSVRFGLHVIAEKALAELLDHRAMVKRLEAWAVELDRLGHLYEMTQREFAAELRKRMGGDRG